MIPEFDVFNLKDTLHFYVDLIEFHVEYDRPENKLLGCKEFLILDLNGYELSFS